MVLRAALLRVCLECGLVVLDSVTRRGRPIYRLTHAGRILLGDFPEKEKKRSAKSLTACRVRSSGSQRRAPAVSR